MVLVQPTLAPVLGALGLEFHFPDTVSHDLSPSAPPVLAVTVGLPAGN